MTIQNLILIFFGGGLGSVFRFWLSKTLNPLFDNFYVGTFTVNIIGSLLLGVLLGLEIKFIIQRPMHLFLIVGFCGGFTTFSTFTLESFNLLKSDQYHLFLIYALTSLITGILAVALGYILVK